MITEPMLDQLFGPARIEGDYRLPTRAEIALRLQIERTNLIFAAIAAEQWAFQHRQITPDRHPTRMGRYGSAVLAGRRGATDEDRFSMSSGWNFKLRQGDGELI